jgi:kynurenine formamidase
MCVPACEEFLREASTRRTFLTAAAAGIAGTLAGCSKLSRRATASASHAASASVQPASFKRVVDLTHTLDPQFPTYSGNPQFSTRTMTTTKKNGYYTKQWRLFEHTGTHLDAPVHFSENGRFVHEIPADELICPLVIVDVSAHAEQNSDYALRVEDLKAWERTHGRIPPRACVAMRSGWDTFTTGPKFRNADRKGVMHFPGFHQDATQFLHEERQVSGIAVDTLSLDIGATGKFAVHTSWLPNGHWGLECVANLSAVPASGATIVVGAPKVLNGTGGPSRVFALV